MRRALEQVPGFKSVRVDFKKNQAKVVYDPNRKTPEELAKTVAKETGFSVAVEPPRSGKSRRNE